MDAQKKKPSKRKLGGLVEWGEKGIKKEFWGSSGPRTFEGFITLGEGKEGTGVILRGGEMWGKISESWLYTEGSIGRGIMRKSDPTKEKKGYKIGVYIECDYERNIGS